MVHLNRLLVRSNDGSTSGLWNNFFAGYEPYCISTGNYDRRFHSSGAERFAVVKGVQLRKDKEKVMVARLWRGLTPEAKAPEYQRYLEPTGVKNCLETNGSRGVLILRRTASEKKTEFLFISFWESLECISRFAGTNID